MLNGVPIGGYDRPIKGMLVESQSADLLEGRHEQIHAHRDPSPS
jgi:hypothetical protein